VAEAEGGRNRSKLEKDFDRVGAAIKEVINVIGDKNNENER
jgi:hypothetical protein